MKSILVPTDFSSCSIDAAIFAADMAAAVNAELHLLNVFQVPVTYVPDAPVVLYSMEDERIESELQLCKLKSRLESRNEGLRIIVHAEMGNPVDEIKTFCDEIQPFVVIMGSKGSGGFERLVFGSTILSAIWQVHTPVIAIPPGKQYGHGFKKIGFACDFRHETGMATIRLLRDLVQIFDAKLYVLNVADQNHHYTKEEVIESSVLQEDLGEIDCEFHHLANGDIEIGLTLFAQSHGLDLIIAVPARHKLLEGLFKQSITKQLILHASIPVMCTH